MVEKGYWQEYSTMVAEREAPCHTEQAVGSRQMLCLVQLSLIHPQLQPMFDTKYTQGGSSLFNDSFLEPFKVTIPPLSLIETR